MSDPNQCPFTCYDRATDEETRCVLPAGHDGRHDDGCMTWGDPVMPRAASTPEPPPTPGTGDVWQSVIDGLPPGKLRDACVERRAFGLRKYGTVLQANNGRNWRTDALQEALDGIAYAAQGVVEGDPEATEALERAIAHAETVVRLVGGVA